MPAKFASLIGVTSLLVLKKLPHFPIIEPILKYITLMTLYDFSYILYASSQQWSSHLLLALIYSVTDA